MPQHFVTLDYPSMMQPITSSITNTVNDFGRIGARLYTGLQDAKQQQIKKDQAYQQIYNYFSPVRGLTVDWDQMRPREDETDEQYSARLNEEMVPVYDQLGQMGLDPFELNQVTKVPGRSYSTLVKLRDKRLAGLLVNPDQSGAYKDIMAGQLPLDEINRRRGTNLTQADYERTAGLSPIAPGMPPDAAAASDHPLAMEQAKSDTLASPVSYDTAKRIYQQMSPEGQSTYAPLMTPIAGRVAANVASEPGQTLTGYVKGAADKGLPITTETSAIPMNAIAQDRLFDMKKQYESETLDYKKRYAAMRSKEQDNSLLKTLIGWDMFQKKMQQSYGAAGEKSAQYLHGLFLKREDLDAQLSAADSYIPGVSKGPQPDPAVIMDQMQIIDNEIDRVRNGLPNFDKMVDHFKYGAPQITYPQVKKPGFETPGMPKTAPVQTGGAAPLQEQQPDMESMAISWLKKQGNPAPTAAQVAKVVSAFKNKTGKKKK